MSSLQKWFGLARREAKNMKRALDEAANELLAPGEQHTQHQLQRIPVRIPSNNHNNSHNPFPFSLNNGAHNNNNNNYN